MFFSEKSCINEIRSICPDFSHHFLGAAKRVSITGVFRVRTLGRAGRRRSCAAVPHDGNPELAGLVGEVADPDIQSAAPGM